MAKYTKVYMKNKKESNISLPLRYSLLRSIFVQNMSVKDAASKWKVHYSSAKIIARTAKRNKLYLMFDQACSAPSPLSQCSYQEISPSEIKKQEVSNDGNEYDAYNNGESLTYSYPLAQQQKIQILSSIGWNFFSQNMKSLQSLH